LTKGIKTDKIWIEYGNIKWILTEQDIPISEEIFTNRTLKDQHSQTYRKCKKWLLHI